MNKLKNRIFAVLFLMFTLFLVIIVFLFNFENYKKESENINLNLNRMDNALFKPKDIKNENINRNDKENIDVKGLDIGNKIFIDSLVYTVVYDSNTKQIQDVITHSSENTDLDSLKEYATILISNKSNLKNRNSNLYFDEYSYSFKGNNTVVIIDNKYAKTVLLDTLQKSTIVFVIVEILWCFISYKIAIKITRPVKESFEKQKQFVADASHELKTPISVILASSEAMENDRDKKKWTSIIKSESERMNKLVCDLLDLAKTENDSIKFELIKTNLSKIIEKSCLSFEALMFENNITLEYNIDENIELNVNTDQIKQLISILIDNAIKHSKKDGKIIVNLKNDKKDIILEVKNQGDKIKKGEEERIFERFYRVDESHNRDDNRYGLGLAIAKNICNIHNAKISAFSDEDYTTFKVVFKK